MSALTTIRPNGSHSVKKGTASLEDGVNPGDAIQDLFNLEARDRKPIMIECPTKLKAWIARRDGGSVSGRGSTPEDALRSLLAQEAVEKSGGWFKEQDEAARAVEKETGTGADSCIAIRAYPGHGVLY